MLENCLEKYMEACKLFIRNGKKAILKECIDINKKRRPKGRHFL